jgi:gliding motility-associated-like protein
MKKKIFFFLFTAAICLNAQTVFWTEGFGTTCSQNNPADNTTTTNGTWVVTHVSAAAANANQWFISATESGMAVGTCGSGCLTTPTLINRTLHISNVPSSPSAGFFCPTGDCGAAYDSGGGCGFGLGCVSVNDRAESPVINCAGMNTITLSFSYLEGGDPGNDYMEVMYSANGGTTWSSLGTPAVTATTCGASQGLWTNYSIALPVSANNNSNVKIGFRWQNNDDGVGNDPSVAVDSIKLFVPSAATPVVTITPSPTTTVCQSSTLTLNGSATNGPITAWSWSVAPTAGVVFTPNAAAQNPAVTFTASGVYTFTLQATNASGSGTSVQSITVTPSVAPSVSISANPGNPICAGQAVSFTATPTNGGTTPIYQWQVNGANAGTNSSNFSSSALNNNDVISVIFTSNATCSFPTSATATYTVQVTNAITPSVSIAANPVNPICTGQTVSFTATPTGGGTIPAYQWQVNGTNEGTNSPNFSSSTLTNNAVVSVTLTSNSSCASPSIAVASYTVQLAVAITPSVSISVSPSATVCSGNVVTFGATVSGGGTSPSFQWLTNGVTSGTNSSTYTVVPNNNDQVYVTMTSNAACALPLTTNSNTLTISIVAGSSLTAGPLKTICSGDSKSLSSNGTNWVWSPNNGLSCTSCQNPKASPAATTVYTVTGSLGTCTTSATETVVVNQSPTALFAASGTVPGVPQTVNFVNASVNASGYLWNFGDNSGTVIVNDPAHTYNAVGVYTVTLIAYNANGCTDTISSTLIVSDTAGLSMPNIFTPNGDGINDVFSPNAHGLKTLDCTIYDRWGIKITALDLTTQQYWDGHTTSGIACSDGTYFYTVTATDVNGKSYSLKGFIQLIR